MTASRVSLTAVAAVVLALGGCGGSSSSNNVKPPPKPIALTTLSGNHGISDVTIKAGETHDGKRGVFLECPAGGQPCDVKVAEDGKATYLGGKPVVKMNRMVLAANNVPGDDSDGEHAMGLVTRIGTTNSHADGLGLIRQAAMASDADVVQSTMPTEPKVTASATWAAGEDGPTLGLKLENTAFGLLALDSPVALGAASDSTVPVLAGWHREALTHKVNGGTTVHAVMYSNIEQTKEDGGPLTGKFDLSWDGGEEEGAKVGKGKIDVGEDTSERRNVQIDVGAISGSGDIRITASRSWDRPVPVGGYAEVTYQELGESGELVGDPLNGRLVCVDAGRRTPDAGRKAARACNATLKREA